MKNEKFYHNVSTEDFCGKLDFHELPAGVPENAYTLFTEFYIKCRQNGYKHLKSFDCAMGNIDTMWFPNTLAKYENAMQIFGTESGLF